MVTSDSWVILVAGFVVAAAGLLAFNRAHDQREVGGGYGSGLSPGAREALSVLVIVFGLVLMLSSITDF